jgi:6-phosphogluconate dehydrogenase
MQIGMVGLGKMGGNMCRRLARRGHEVIGFDLDESARETLAAEGIATVPSLEALARALRTPRVAWVMVPAGPPTAQTIDALAALFERGDVIVDGGNSNYREAAPTAARLAARGVGFLDAGTSGGIWGLTEGYCLMVGGDPAVVALAEPVFRDLAPEGGYAHVGPVGAGHFVKMVHNGIEYGLMQAYAEGFELLASANELSLDLHQIASIWRYGSVVRSWLLELTERTLAPGSGFETIEPYVVDSGEGRWTVEEAIDRGVPVPVIATSLFRRFESRETSSFAARLLAALRNQFGGHAVRVADPAAAGPAGAGATPAEGGHGR